MTMDFLERLVLDVLDKQGYYARVVSPTLVSGNSIAVTVMPARDHRHYYDGSKDQGFAFQVMTKHENQLEAYQTLLRITSLLSGINDIPSNNGSYDFCGITITTDPNVVGQDERYYIYGAQFSAELYIKGVVNNG
ncbi:phage tail terminator protein [Halalkalibacterium ligniniphilum]|uniref:phage tail terminator protein n=1 Tax=Halalkalibacterium ligniniphilum TaxID=1134413 RepID=UPI00036D4854|nr:minor capsid protein [Halalkalibacterium ligniniphilum]